ncbi:MAG: DNA-directed RNA polymerase subunit omega [Bacteroidales bacterium]|nr:DNA-directed RNA polymerase subunit omega [Bacteroidales bacterium]
MDLKKTNAAVTTITRDVDKLEEMSGNIYQTVMIVAKRANQIAVELKEELHQKLEEFSSYTESLEEIFENREQIEISRMYERLPKPTSIALQEFIENKLFYRIPEQTEKIHGIAENNNQ